jgi:hypothetical protein
MESNQVDQDSQQPIRKHPGLIWVCLITILITTFVTAIHIRSVYDRSRLARLVGINSYALLSDSNLDEAMRAEYPVGMKEKEAIQKLRERGLYEVSLKVERRLSEDNSHVEYFIARIPVHKLSLVNKEYNLVLEFDSSRHRVVKSSVSTSLTGF